MTLSGSQGLWGRARLAAGSETWPSCGAKPRSAFGERLWGLADARAQCQASPTREQETGEPEGLPLGERIVHKYHCLGSCISVYGMCCLALNSVSFCSSV